MWTFTECICTCAQKWPSRSGLHKNSTHAGKLRAGQAQARMADAPITSSAPTAPTGVHTGKPLLPPCPAHRFDLQSGLKHRSSPLLVQPWTPLGWWPARASAQQCTHTSQSHAPQVRCSSGMEVAHWLHSARVLGGSLTAGAVASVQPLYTACGVGGWPCRWRSVVSVTGRVLGEGH